jgi:DNA-binding CsgD family transcriptional regulator
MDLTSRELALIADVFRLLADQPLPEDLLCLEVGSRLLDLLRADGLLNGVSTYVWSGEAIPGGLRIRRGMQREAISDRERALFDLVRPAFLVARARSHMLAIENHAADKVADHAPRTASEAFNRLTRRERDVVALVVEGLLDKEIAERLGISYTTVRTHLDRSFQKLGVSNRSRLARLVQAAWG